MTTPPTIHPNERWLSATATAYGTAKERALLGEDLV
ncbi:hypothetical protein SAMN05216489_00080 [Streptomyces sp. 3213]|nr:hypothetical protein SAMN05216489_00080 [Streptomyces sp. 3213] [Streptomyces sp. 3213.3]